MRLLTKMKSIQILCVTWGGGDSVHKCDQHHDRCDQLTSICLICFQTTCLPRPELPHRIVWVCTLHWNKETKRGTCIWSFLDIQLHNSGTWCPILVKFCMWSAFLSLKQNPQKLRSSDLHRGQSSKQAFFKNLASNIDEPK